MRKCDRCGRFVGGERRYLAGETLCSECYARAPLPPEFRDDGIEALMVRLARAELRMCGAEPEMRSEGWAAALCGGLSFHRAYRPESDRATLQSIERRALKLAQTTSGAARRSAAQPRALAVTVPDYEEATT